MKPDPVEKKKTLKLKIEEHANFMVTGISCHENDYRLVWAINNQLNMQFIRVENLIVFDPKTSLNLEFSRYLYHDENRYLKYHLISNRCPDGFLFPMVRNFDYLLQIIGDMNDQERRNAVKKLKSVAVISAVFMLPLEKLKGVTHILQE
jgi:hypothetical protein